MNPTLPTPCTAPQQLEADTKEIIERLKKELFDLDAQRSKDRATIDEITAEVERAQEDRRLVARSAGVRWTQQFLARVWKGDVAWRLCVWRNGVRAAAKMNHAAERDALEAKLRGRSHEAGLRMLWQAFVVMVKGEMALRVGVWRQGARASVMKEMEMRHDSLMQSELRATSHGAGMRISRQWIRHQTREDMSTRIKTWHSGMQHETHRGNLANLQRASDAKAARQKADLQRSLEAKAASEARSAGVRAIKLFWTRMLKGTVAVRLQLWRQQTKDNDDDYHALQTSLEAQMRTTLQGAGSRILRQMMIRNE